MVPSARMPKSVVGPMSSARSAPCAEGCSGPQKVMHRHFEPSRLAGALALVSLLMSTSLCAAWLLAPVSLRWWLRLLIRPDASLGAVLCACCLVLHARGVTGPIQQQVGRGLAVLATAAGAVSLWSDFSHEPLSILGPTLHIPHGDARMAPLAAVEIVCTGIASLLLREDKNARSNFVASALSLFSSVLCGGFLFAASFAVSAFHPFNPSRVMLPAAALTLLFANIGLLAANPSHRLIRDFVGDHPAAVAARRLLIMSGISLLMFGIVGVGLQSFGVINFEEATALLSCLAVILLVAILCNHARLVHELLSNKMTHLHQLHSSLQERRRLVDQLSRDRARMEGVLHAAVSHSIISTDTDGTIDMFTEGAENILGYQADEVVGKLNFVALHDKQEISNRAAALGVPAGFDVFRALPNLGLCDQREWTHLTKDNKRVPVLLSVSALRGNKERIEGYVAVARDISDDQRARQEREAFLHIGQELLLAADAKDGRIKGVSPSFERVLGYAPSDLLGQIFFDFVHPADRVATTLAVETLRNGVLLERFENRWRDRNGRYRWLTWDASVPYADGLIYSGAWDITEGKRRAAEVERLLANEQHLIGVVSHDLRNPISAISMSAQLIERHREAPQRVVDYAQRIVSACGKAERLIHSVLDLSEARSGQGLSICPEEVDAAQIAQRSVEELRLAHPGRTIALDGEPEAVCYADSDRVAQVLGNLLSNAVKYGTEQKPVTLRVETTPTKVALAVHNHGPPIPKNAIANLFKPMLRGTGPSGHAERNIGLGLYIVSEIVQRHGGTIDVESSERAGTTFRVLLPKEAQKLAQHEQS